MHPNRYLLPLLLSVSWVAAAEPPPAPKTFDPQAIDAYLAGQLEPRGVVGLSVALMRRGEIVFAKGYGQASLEPRQAVTPDTLFGIGSVTKQFTCAAVLLLAEDGKLDVQDKVAKYYPDLTQANDVTLYDLMTHVSGYPDYYPLDFVDRRLEKPRPVDEVIREYAGGKLDFPPRTRWSYSNTGYLILGRVVEKVSGEALGAFLERRIFKPLGMAHTRFEPAPGGPGLAVGYHAFALGPPEKAVPEGGGWIHAAGGLFASASDLAKWDLALMTGQVLKPASYQVMTRPRELANGKVMEYGCGLSVLQRGGEPILRHTGGVSGFLSYNTLLPRTRSAVVVLTNADYVDVRPLHNLLVNLLAEPNDGPAVAVPKVQGKTAKEAATALLKQLQAGNPDRAQFGEDYSQYLTPARVQGAAARLGPLGEPTAVEVEDLSERGGMEVAVVRFTFKTGAVRGLLYRTPDGKIQEFLITKG